MQKYIQPLNQNNFVTPQENYGATAAKSFSPVPGVSRLTPALKAEKRKQYKFLYNLRGVQYFHQEINEPAHSRNVVPLLNMEICENVTGVFHFQIDIKFWHSLGYSTAPNYYHDYRIAIEQIIAGFLQSLFKNRVGKDSIFDYYGGYVFNRHMTPEVAEEQSYQQHVHVVIYMLGSGFLEYWNEGVGKSKHTAPFLAWHIAHSMASLYKQKKSREEAVDVQDPFVNEMFQCGQKITADDVKKFVSVSCLSDKPSDLQVYKFSLIDYLLHDNPQGLHTGFTWPGLVSLKASKIRYDSESPFYHRRLVTALYPSKNADYSYELLDAAGVCSVQKVHQSLKNGTLDNLDKKYELLVKDKVHQVYDNSVIWDQKVQSQYPMPKYEKPASNFEKVVELTKRVSQDQDVPSFPIVRTFSFGESVSEVPEIKRVKGRPRKDLSLPTPKEAQANVIVEYFKDRAVSIGHLETIDILNDEAVRKFGKTLTNDIFAVICKRVADAGVRYVHPSPEVPIRKFLNDTDSKMKDFVVNMNDFQKKLVPVFLAALVNFLDSDCGRKLLNWIWSDFLLDSEERRLKLNRILCLWGESNAGKSGILEVLFDRSIFGTSPLTLADGRYSPPSVYESKCYLWAYPDLNRGVSVDALMKLQNLPNGDEILEIKNASKMPGLQVPRPLIVCTTWDLSGKFSDMISRREARMETPLVQFEKRFVVLNLPEPSYRTTQSRTGIEQIPDTIANRALRFCLGHEKQPTRLPVWFCQNFFWQFVLEKKPLVDLDNQDDFAVQFMFENQSVNNVLFEQYQQILNPVADMTFVKEKNANVSSDSIDQQLDEVDNFLAELKSQSCKESSGFQKKQSEMVISDDVQKFLNELRDDPLPESNDFQKAKVILGQTKNDDSFFPNGFDTPRSESRSDMELSQLQLSGVQALKDHFRDDDLSSISADLDCTESRWAKF